MAGIQKHNKKSWSDYQRYSSHVYDEKFLLELFHNERDYEMHYLCSPKSALEVSNAKIEGWKSETNYVSRDGNDYYLRTTFIAPVTGEYNIEVVYRTATEGSFISLWFCDGNEESRFMKGSPEYRSRMIKNYHFQKGEHMFHLHCNANIHVIGIAIKSITEYRADDSLKRENRLTLIKATHKVSSMTSADELSFELLYDSEWKDPQSLTNFLFDYRDEVNFHLINNDGEMEQVFGGYVSSCTLNSTETTLTVNCAGRLIDGEKRFIVEEMTVGGDASVIEENYPLEYTRKFDDYIDATEYLFDNFEQPLSSNVSQILGLKKYEGVEWDYTNRESLDRCNAENVSKDLMPMGAYIRNNSGTKITERLDLFNKEWFRNGEPIFLDDYPIFYITYGMGEAVTQLEAEQTETDVGGVGSGVSVGGVITTNMYPTCGCCGGTVPYKRYKKSWKNYCPNCKKSGTLKDTPKGTVDGELTCSMALGGCDADYCGYCGGDKWGGGKCRRVKLTPASASENGNAGDGTGVSKSTVKVFDQVNKQCFKYNFGAGISKVSQMKKQGYGDDRAFSELIFSELVDMGVGAKIVQSPKGNNNAFNSVLVKNTEGKYVDYPYTSDDFKKHFGTNLTPSSASVNGSVSYSRDGLGVNIKDGIIEGTVATTNGFDKDKPFMAYIVMEYSVSDGKAYNGNVEIRLNDNYKISTKVTNGNGNLDWGNFANYDGEFFQHTSVKTDEWNGVLNITLPNGDIDEVIVTHGEGTIDLSQLENYTGEFGVKPLSNSIDTSHHLSFIDFTAQKPDNYMTWSGLTPLFLNNIVNTSSVNIIDRMREQWKTPHVYLHRLYFEYVVGDEALWASEETTDDEGNTTVSNTDNSSHRMILQNAGFRNGTLLNPVDLSATGKTVNSVLATALESGELKMKMYPARHRRDDKVILTKDKSYEPVFTIDESKNVLAISSWNFTPASDFMDRSLVVFKNKMEDEEKGAVYNYTESRNPHDILRYGEINKLTSLSDDISKQEAYYNAKKEFSNVVGDSMTITVFGCPPNLHIGDYVECLFEDATYNDVKEVKSIEHEFDIKQAPYIQTKLGLNRPNPELALRRKFEVDRQTAKQHETLFSRTAVYDNNTYTFEE